MAPELQGFPGRYGRGYVGLLDAIKHEMSKTYGNGDFTMPDGLDRIGLGFSRKPSRGSAPLPFCVPRSANPGIRIIGEVPGAGLPEPEAPPGEEPQPEPQRQSAGPQVSGAPVQKWREALKTVVESATDSSVQNDAALTVTTLGGTRLQFDLSAMNKVRELAEKLSPYDRVKLETLVERLVLERLEFIAREVSQFDKSFIKKYKKGHRIGFLGRMPENWRETLEYKQKLAKYWSTEDDACVDPKELEKFERQAKKRIRKHLRDTNRLKWWQRTPDNWKATLCEPTFDTKKKDFLQKNARATKALAISQEIETTYTASKLARNVHMQSLVAGDGQVSPTTELGMQYTTLHSEAIDKFGAGYMRANGFLVEDGFSSIFSTLGDDARDQKFELYRKLYNALYPTESSGPHFSGKFWGLFQPGYEIPEKWGDFITYNTTGAHYELEARELAQAQAVEFYRALIDVESRAYQLGSIHDIDPSHPDALGEYDRAVAAVGEFRSKLGGCVRLYRGDGWRQGRGTFSAGSEGKRLEENLINEYYLDVVMSGLQRALNDFEERLRELDELCRRVRDGQPPFEYTPAQARALELYKAIKSLKVNLQTAATNSDSAEIRDDSVELLCVTTHVLDPIRTAQGSLGTIIRIMNDRDISWQNAGEFDPCDRTAVQLKADAYNDCHCSKLLQNQETLDQFIGRVRSYLEVAVVRNAEMRIQRERVQRARLEAEARDVGGGSSARAVGGGSEDLVKRVGGAGM